MCLAVVALGIMAVGCAPARATEYMVCFGDRGEEMRALAEAGDDLGATLYGRLYCWRIDPPDRGPAEGDADWKPYPDTRGWPKDTMVSWWKMKEAER